MDTLEARKRIWEIDVLRGLCIPGMIVIHLIYDLVNLYGLVDWRYPMWYDLVKNNYGVLFVLLSGVSVTLGSRCLRRGLTVFFWGMVITAVTLGMYALGMAGEGILIYFGVLHCIGVCMVLWRWLSRLPAGALAVLGAVLTAVGWWLRTQVFETPAFLILGFVYPGYASSDFFPLMPNLGYFLLGAAVGKRFYREKKSLLPRVDAARPVLRALDWMGRHSLTIYLLHQPILTLLVQPFLILRKLG